MKETYKALLAPTLGQLLELDIPPREHLLEPWLKEGESVMVFAEPGRGKSLFALTLSLAIAGQGEFLGWTAPKARRVLLVDGEMPMIEIKERAQALLGAVPNINLEEAQNNLQVLARQYQSPDSDFPDISEPEGREEYLRIAMEGLDGKGPYDLVILDNLSTLATNIEDENAAGQFNDVIKFLMKLKQAGIACVLVHHANKSGAKYRGSSKLATTFEVILQLKEPDRSTVKVHSASFTLCWIKYRGYRDDSITNKDIYLEGGKWRHEISKGEEAAVLVELLKTLDFVSQGELAKELGWGTTKVHARKYDAFSKELITERQWKDYIRLAKEKRDSRSFDDCSYELDDSRGEDLSTDF